MALPVQTAQPLPSTFHFGPITAAPLEPQPLPVIQASPPLMLSSSAPPLPVIQETPPLTLSSTTLTMQLAPLVPEAQLSEELARLRLENASLKQLAKSALPGTKTQIATAILNYLSGLPPQPTLTIAKSLLGPDATTKQINPALYQLLQEGKVTKMAGPKGERPHWSRI